ncbi:type IV pilus assembly protein PilN [Tibeticola sediminis]|uniref:Type IV pilus assembly protein PilN n=1 Tax=Tibeticola sediminis TaxID=1917811 RepID=A0A3N4V138_9BURK|nr:PilN domain-containing protein [Tibeticola sediminis]RPE67550.1 type IV pilus assembly protein PilN [Tibeticola sediminis]
MILINLLPHREEARKRRREEFYAGLGAAAVAGLLVGGLIYFWYDIQISDQQGRNAFLVAENRRLDAQIKDVATLQDEINALRARQEAVESLQADRNLPVHLLNELVRLLPEGAYLTAVRQEDSRITLSGVAQSNDRVSELLRNLANDSPWLARPELVEIVAGSVALSPRDQRRVSNFTIRVSLQRTAAAAANAASASVKR